MHYSQNLFWVMFGFLGQLGVRGSKYFGKIYIVKIPLFNTNNLIYYTQNTALGHFRVFGSLRGQGVMTFGSNGT